jgi:anti-sigma regulatory factor (Ser/Thr protein kinase)
VTLTMENQAPSDPTAFRHEALFYRGEEEFLAGTVPFIRDGVSAGEPVLVAVHPDKAERIKAELNGEAEAVQFVDMPKLGHNPARIIPAWRDFVAEHLNEASPVRGIGEPIWPGRSGDELAECGRHEWLLNLAFAGSPAWWLLCPYDAERLDPAVLETAWVTHPHVAEKGDTRTSRTYRDPLTDPDPFNDPLPPPPDGADELAFTRDDLPEMRRLVYRWAAAAGIGDQATGDLLVAANEVATNSLRYGGARGTLIIWREPDRLLCELRDGGVLKDPLAGRERPLPSWARGRGLWLANQFCDLVQIRSNSEGNVARLHMAAR